MRRWIAGVIAVAALVLGGAAVAAAPDEAFTQAHYAYVEAKRQEFLAPIIAKSLTPTAAQSNEATCRAIMWWKMANPGGEAKLTFAALVALRRAEVLCGQKMRRAPPLPIETGNPPRTFVSIPTAGTLDNDGGNEAVEDFLRWHQVTLGSAPTIMDYVRAQLVVWGMYGDGKKLYEALAKALEAQKAAQNNKSNTQGADHDVDMARHRLAAAEAEESTRLAEEYARAHPITVENAASTADYVNAQVFLWGRSEEGRKLYDALAEAQAAQREVLAGHGDLQRANRAVDAAQQRVADAEAAASEKAEREWRAAHPGQPETWPPGESGLPGDSYRTSDPRVWSGNGMGNSYPLPLEQLPRDKQIEILEWEQRVAEGSVDPLDAEAWAHARGVARQPIEVGSNDEVGSGARTRDKAVSTVLGIAGGMLGGSGGGSSNGPQLARCHVADRDMTEFVDSQSGVTLRVAARREGDNVLLFADISRSPDSGTFQAALLDNRNGQWRPPADAGICKLHGEWNLSVSWTRTTYVNNQVIGRESGGWSKSGNLELLGAAGSAGAPAGLWKQLGFSNASHGARMVQLTYPAPAPQLANGGMDVVIHVTRPEQNPVTTVPFVMHMAEGPNGISFARIQ